MSRGIRLSEAHGVNPSLSQCFFCGDTKNEILLFGRLPGDKEAPKRACYDKEPCDKCKGHMEQGIMFISVKENDPEYRTGKICVIKEEAVRNMLKEPMLGHVLKVRACFISDETWAAVGFPGKEDMP